jgi:hypothetical protein
MSAGWQHQFLSDAAFGADMAPQPIRAAIRGNGSRPEPSPVVKLPILCHFTSLMTVSPAQCRAARALLRWSQDELHQRSKVAQRTIADFERAARRPFERTLNDLQEALEAGGVVFLPENGEWGEGVRFEKLSKVRGR